MKRPMPAKTSLLLSFVLAFIMSAGQLALYSQERETGDTAASNFINARYNAGESETAGPVLPEGLTGFSKTSLLLLNQFGSFGFRNNGLNVSVATEKYQFFTSYMYRNFEGYLAHSSEYWNIFNIGIMVMPTDHSSLTVEGSYLNGMVKLPGSLTKAEFEQDPYQADRRSVERDEKNSPSDANLNIGYKASFGKSLQQEVEVKVRTLRDFYESATREYRIVTCYGIGLDAEYSNKSPFLKRTNTVSAGIRLELKPERTEYYENLGGQKGDLIEQLTSESTGKAGGYITDTFGLVSDRLFLSLAGNYGYEVYKVNEETLPSRSDRRTFSSFTPRAGLEFEATPWVSLFASFHSGYISPADIELESPDPFYLYNPTLKPETSINYDAGIYVHAEKEDSSFVFPSVHGRVFFFQNFLNNEIVPYEVFGDVFFRNAEKSGRYGFNVKGSLEIIRDLSFDLSYIYSHFRYNTYEAISIETDSTGNIIQVDRVYSGNTSPGIPDNYLDLSLSYKYPVSRKVSIVARLNYAWMSGYWVDDLNSDRTSPFSLLNALVHCDMKFGHLSLAGAAGVNNILDAIYAGSANVNSANNRFYVAGSPRNYAFTINVGYTF
jgi:iron complex outermembrane recepter protein